MNNQDIIAISILQMNSTNIPRHLLLTRMHSKAAEMLSIGLGSDKKSLFTPPRIRSANELRSTPPMLNSPKIAQSVRTREINDFVLEEEDNDSKPVINTGPD